MTEYRSMHDFYAEVPRRESSPECDFGVDWVCPSVAGGTTWRVSWIVETGEVYAFEQAGAGRVKVLGYVPKVGS